jgi:hypothetical protein
MAVASASVCGCTGVGIPKLRWLGITALRPLHVCVSAWCSVTVKGDTFGLPKGENMVAAMAFTLVKPSGDTGLWGLG